MKFTYNGDTYEIEFQRNRKKKDTTDKGLAPSRLTTVRIFKNKAGALPGQLIAEASSACSVLDPFNMEKGRLGALRLVTKPMEKRFKAAVWAAYMDRFPKKPVETKKG